MSIDLTASSDITHLDALDWAIASVRLDRRSCATAPLVGDWVDFTDGSRRIGHVSGGGGVQTAAGARFRLEVDGNMAYSGRLHALIPAGRLTLADEVRTATAWFLHHDEQVGGQPVEFEASVRVWRVDAPVPRP